VPYGTFRISNDSPPTPFDINQLHLTIALSQKRFYVLTLLWSELFARLVKRDAV
jgi:hypothetical protein